MFYTHIHLWTSVLGQQPKYQCISDAFLSEFHTIDASCPYHVHAPWAAWYRIMWGLWGWLMDWKCHFHWLTNIRCLHKTWPKPASTGLESSMYCMPDGWQTAVNIPIPLGQNMKMILYSSMENTVFCQWIDSRFYITNISEMQVKGFCGFTISIQCICGMKDGF